MTKSEYKEIGMFNDVQNSLEIMGLLEEGKDRKLMVRQSDFVYDNLQEVTAKVTELNFAETHSGYLLTCKSEHKKLLELCRDNGLLIDVDVTKNYLTSYVNS